jgi:hypothetical protein
MHVTREQEALSPRKINLVTLTGRDVDSLTTRLSVGSFGFTEEEVASGWSHGPFDGYISIFNHMLEGYREWSQENYQKNFSSIGYTAVSTANRVYFFFGRLDQNNPSSLTKGEMYANRRDIIEELETARQRKTPTITLTSVPRSAAAELSDTVLISAVRRTPLTVESVAARVAQLVVIDIICAIIALRKKSELDESTERITTELSKKQV